MHNMQMRPRAAIDLDKDAYEFALAYAHAKGIPLGSAVSELLRRVERTLELPVRSAAGLKKTGRGYLVKAKTGRAITPELVKVSAEDDLTSS